ncbi:MAG: tRNA (N(6)-L-threonylcarbamoyladenosine(37)-C(2))-methylthiotransferase MtaB, partial [Candidatus Hydrogenedentes bacterium]|nr:tRNA (N(6)-L-threonylcarbamoyladenosine(37)-C(2))-methylthiotransferase MtaB [Candidatus Hydrogenedentota bacterium]
HTHNNRPRASLYTLGCRLNQSETQLIGERLVDAGYTLVPFGEPAELGIVHTCTVTNEADAKSRKAVRGFIRKNPDAYLAVIGCYAQMDPKTLSAIEGVDLIVGNQEKLNVLDYVTQGKNAHPLIVRDRITRDDFSIELTPQASNIARRTNLKIQDGCDFMCSFCVIPFARGRARSRDLDNLLEEARGLVARGAKELVLTGVNIGTYASRGRTLVEVVDALNTIHGLRRIRISSIEPTTIPEALFDRMNDPAHALVPYLHIPLQSGSNRVLESMRRLYTREAYLAFIEGAAARVPGICIGTDIMVGAPGETDADFEATCDLLETGPLAYAHVFKYSAREGTAATRYPDQVPPEIRNRRGAILRRLSAGKTREFHARQLNTTVEVLFESRQNGYWQGYTGNFVRVSVCSDAILSNALREVTLVESFGEFVSGRLTPETCEVV